MGYILAIGAVLVVVGYLAIRSQSVADEGKRGVTSPNTDTTKPRMTSRRKLRDILASEYYDTLTDWEKHFCHDVNKQGTGLTWNQTEKIDEIWASIIMDEHHIEDCEAAFKLLKEIMESPAFETLPDKEKKYMHKIYSEGEVSGSYRLQRVRDLHSRIFEGGK